MDDKKEPKKKEVKELAFNMDDSREELIKKAEAEKEDEQRDDN